jgi:hypothetical protein
VLQVLLQVLLLVLQVLQVLLVLLQVLLQVVLQVMLQKARLMACPVRMCTESRAVFFSERAVPYSILPSH